MGKKQLFLMSVLLVLGLTGCGDKVKPVSLSDDSAIKAQSEAVIEQSKAVVEESKALEKAKGNNDTVEETEPEKPVSSSKEISHPFMILEYEGEKFDIANDTMKDLAHLQQKMGDYSGIDLSLKMEPYGSSGCNGAFVKGAVYNPYNKEIEYKEAKLGGYDYLYSCTIKFESNTPDNLKFLNGRANFNSTFEEWVEVFKEEAEHIRNESLEIEDEYANVLEYDFDNDNKWNIKYKFKLNNGRKVDMILRSHDGKVSSIEFTFDPYYE